MHHMPRPIIQSCIRHMIISSSLLPSCLRNNKFLLNTIMQSVIVHCCWPLHHDQTPTKHLSVIKKTNKTLAIKILYFCQILTSIVTFLLAHFVVSLHWNKVTTGDITLESGVAILHQTFRFILTLIRTLDKFDW